MKPTAWVLAVVSSESQSETIAFQRDWAERVATAEGWRITRTFEGVSSGKDGTRSLVKSMLSALKASKPPTRPKYLLMTRLDRLGRGEYIIDTQLAVFEIAKLGVTIWTREPAGEQRADSLFDQLAVALSAMQASLENRVRRDKLIAVYKRKREAGLVVGNRRPYGLMLSKDGHDIAREPQAQTVREIFRLRTEGLGHSAICKSIALSGAPNVFKNGEREVRWTTQRIARILTNRSYVPSVIDENTFNQASKIKKHLGILTTRSQRKWPFRLATALTCWCGRKMSGLASGPTKKRVLYYICKADWNHDGKLRLVRAAHLEDQFFAILSAMKTNPDGIHDYIEEQSGDSTKKLKSALATLKRKEKQFKHDRDKIFDLYLSGNVKREDVQSKLDQYAQDIDDISSAIDIVQQRLLDAESAAYTFDSLVKLMDSLPTIYHSATIDQQRYVARIFATDYGLCVESDNSLTLRRPVDLGRQRRPQARELGIQT